jgi:predicted glycosyltransferase involved in capsule biosynthesis
MFDKMSVLMPYLPDHGSRDAALHWVKKYYRTTMPGIELCIGVSTEKAFSRSQGMNKAARQATRDIFVIADGDIFYDPTILIDAAKLLKQHAWVIPFHHQKIINLSESSTKRILKSTPSWPVKAEIKDYTVEKRDMNFAGKINVIHRKTYEKVGGFDERFVGYGWEDNAFQNAVSTLCGPHKRLDRKLYHLWHPPVKAKGNPHWEKNKVLGLKYREANGNKEAMRKLLEGRI